MPCALAGSARGDPEAGTGEVADDGRAGPARRGVHGDAHRLVDHHDGVVVVDDPDPLDDLRDHLERVGLRRGSSRRAWSRRGPGRSCRRRRRRPAPGPGRSGRRPWCARSRTSGPSRRRRARRPGRRARRRCAARRGWSSGRRLDDSDRPTSRVPSSATPRKVCRMIRPAATLMQMSATLKTGQWGSIRKSTTWPWNGSGSRTMRSVRLPLTPPSSSPRASAHPVLRERAGSATGRPRRPPSPGR